MSDGSDKFDVSEDEEALLFCRGGEVAVGTDRDRRRLREAPLSLEEGSLGDMGSVAISIDPVEVLLLSEKQTV